MIIINIVNFIRTMSTVVLFIPPSSMRQTTKCSIADMATLSLNNRVSCLSTVFRYLSALKLHNQENHIYKVIHK